MGFQHFLKLQVLSSFEERCNSNAHLPTWALQYLRLPFGNLSQLIIILYKITNSAVAPIFGPGFTLGFPWVFLGWDFSCHPH